MFVQFLGRFLFHSQVVQRVFILFLLGRRIVSLFLLLEEEWKEKTCESQDLNNTWRLAPGTLKLQNSHQMKRLFPYQHNNIYREGVHWDVIVKNNIRIHNIHWLKHTTKKKNDYRYNK
jgi:hypothetical protein